MAGAHCAITSFLTPPPAITTTPTTARTAVAKKLLVSSSSISAPAPPSPSKLTKRRNHLRRKILKTLTKPYPNTTTTTPILPDEPSTNSIISIESDENDLELPLEEISGESQSAVVGEVEKDLEVSEASRTVEIVGVSDVGVGKFSTRSVVKLGMYLVGIFLFQTICAVWIFGSADTDKEHENSESEEAKNGKELLLNGNGIGNMFHGKSGLKPGVFGYMDEIELEAKIVEIRAMAREAREVERKEAKKNGLVSDFDDDEEENERASLRVKSGIEKEVDARLVKLTNRLNAAQEKSLGSPVGYLNKSGKVEDRANNESLDAKQLDGALLFEKKHKFRSQITTTRNDAKGFKGLDDLSGDNKKNSSSAIDVMLTSESTGSNDSGLFDQGKQLDLLDGDVQGDALETLKEGTGIVQDTSHGRHTDRANKSRESSELETHSFSFGKKNQAVSASSEKRTVLSRNGSSKKREVGSKLVGNKGRDKKSEAKSDLWWLKLPYVLAILLRKSSDPEGPGGLYTLKITSHTPDESDSPYTVAFEDRGDANNFCYLLESFFEDLDDFSADIVPLSTKELLQEEVQSRTMKLIVVKKGQLQLYAGQPLDDVEMDLRSLAE